MSQVICAINYQVIKDTINEEIRRRNSDAKSMSYVPSKYWQDFNKLAGYVRRMADEDLKYIRYHSWHLTSDSYMTYYFFPERAAGLIDEYNYIVPSLQGFRPSESQEGLGYNTPDGKVSVDLLRYMRVLSDLCVHGKITRQDPLSILEIGGGYGLLAQILLSFNPHISYVLCDLEETLFFQAVYLSNELGPERVKFLAGDESSDFKFVPGTVYLMPQWRSSALEKYKFDIAINQQSMQEMNQQQVDNYIDMIQKTCKYFYSCNLDQHIDSIVSRTDIVKNLNDYLASKFSVEWSSKEKIAQAPAPNYSSTSSQCNDNARKSPLKKLLRSLFVAPEVTTIVVEKMVEAPKVHDTDFGDYKVPRMILKVNN